VSFLLDTDICSAYLKGSHAVWQKFIQHSGRLSVSVITSAELFAWVLRAKASSGRRQGVLDLLDDLTLLDVDANIAYKFGEIRAHQLDNGQFTPELDLLIASTALVHNLTLVTHNIQDYSNVPGLNVVDWLAP
jgi:tRNA(fMet)-specific endonuclease VapC